MLDILYDRLEEELKLIKEEQKRHSTMSFKGQQIRSKIPGILIAQNHINRLRREKRKGKA